MAVIQGPSVQVRESSILIKSMRKEVDSHIHNHVVEKLTKLELLTRNTASQWTLRGDGLARSPSKTSRGHRAGGSVVLNEDYEIVFLG